MILHLSRIDGLHRRFGKRVIVFTSIAAMYLTPLVAGPRILQAANGVEHGCGGLHAGMRAWLVRNDPNGSRPAFVGVSFLLLNDGEVPINSTAGGWHMVVDGKEVGDEAGSFFFNGMQPDGGYGILNPGEFYVLERRIEISKYLPTLGEHTLSWRGQGFESSTIKINVIAQ